MDPHTATVVPLRSFAGLTIEEIAMLYSNDVTAILLLRPRLRSGAPTATNDMPARCSVACAGAAKESVGEPE
jgi:hypothetical protein